jgi:phenylacetate-CoA ligase
MYIEVEINEATDDYGKLQTLEKEIRHQVGDEILLKPKVRLVPKGSLPVSEGKAVRVVDKRKVYQ